MNWKDLAEQVLYLKQSQKFHTERNKQLLFYPPDQIESSGNRDTHVWANEDYLCIISIVKKNVLMINEF